MAMGSYSRPPRWYGIPFRVLLLTILGMLLSFAVSTLIGIFGIIVYAAVRGSHPDLTIAYRSIALPVAVSVGLIVVVSMAVVEVRHYRRAKALAEIERIS